ncbi:hypothetical protein C7U92_28225 [Bradyrhizobium sp. WBOS7]|uniref:Uncharacterized protein n=1 Tax=Bradyrhizobium betae TaxID=244734 RepID=A0AAE9SSP9_9BRAD|nr:hypothetical protein [Bradyrhizobium sp. WBOS2]MDD1574543.1 hypothetical protein [Bradyrhizobium sp. WBOS1]MDD1580579.1 hypothetical protein [Bradyrhizobium sp. WBOS7]MDD1603871.1 hypothetical protein [Bradyrhizobium sp. WBOS16]UUO34716.1 hypothetical protein DCK84_09135 [Bradyrhizobium sp. WBOS01]UUO41044.1 hypothetical protein DCM75_09985 [Bradyrhizobium sp. WBOS02]UUO55362.1 hypothetical protein DCM79_21680 [Bradyrhizobium sp. WBOS07]UUO65414.1 hypothetical protein DCM83_09465 [Bradyrh
MPAPSCAAPRPASSPARTSCWTAARSRGRCSCCCRPPKHPRRHGRACPGHPRLAAEHVERGCPGQARA